MTRPLSILDAIAGLTAALIAQDSGTVAVAESRRLLVRQAITDGYTLTEIAAASGITRQRVAQLAKEGN